MTAAYPSSGVSDEMLETARKWRERMEAPAWSAADEAELEVWLQADERHARAFERMGEVFSFFEQHAASPELIGARRALLGRVQRQARGRWFGWDALGSVSRRRIAAGLAVAIVLAGAGAWPLTQQGDIYRTGVGERRIVTLKDGSVVSLDAMSRVSVRYSDGARKLTLGQGQARFDVAHDPGRPFSVTARDRTVVATGTAFNIDLLKPEVRVTLIEGRVLILRKTSPLPLLQPAAPQKPVELRAGEALVASKDGPPASVQTADLQQVTAWQEGRLVFQREPLAEAVERVNRYTDRKITIADAKAADVLVSGVFNTGDVNAFLEAVNGFLPVRVVEGSDGVVLRSLEPAA
jgi:transmembrane sensor